MSDSHGDDLTKGVVPIQGSSDQPEVKKSSSATAHVVCDKVCNLRETSSGPEHDVTPLGFDDKDIAESLKSFVLAVHQKYKDDVDDVTEDVIFVPKSGPVKVTSSGFIVLPKQVSMSGCEISVAGDPVLIRRMCQKVHELDLMENYINKWEEVFTIVQCCPNLTFLNLTKNHMMSSLPDLGQWTMSSLTHLVLNNTLISWEVVINLLHIFPALEELHLSVNNLDTVELTSESSHLTSESSHSIPCYPTLHRLFFIGNTVTQWREINKLGCFFPNLTFLMMSETNVEELGTCDEIQAAFPCLSVLGLNRTNLKSWQEIEKICFFPKLTDVRLNGISFLENLEVKLRRSHTIALLPNISLLNGSPVYDNEREDAERAFIRRYMDSSDKPPRYFELEQQYGRLEPLAQVELKPITSVKLLVKVEDSEGELKSSQLMDIDVRQSIKELKKLLSNVAGCPPTKFRLFHQQPGGSCGGFSKLITGDRKVYSYNLKDGDELSIYCNNA